jgi:hypothetical protein
MVKRSSLLTLCLTLLTVIASPAKVWAAPSLFGLETLKAWVDVRLVSVDGETAWLNARRYGKLRYGGDMSEPVLGEAAILWTPWLTDTLSAYVEVVHTPELEHATGINEAYLKWRPVPKSALRLSARFGQMYPPVSMEHEGTGWTTTHTITPSAINSWIAEEVLVQGLEVSAKTTLAGQQVGTTIGMFRGNDTSGTLLSYRGWALHDLRATATSKLPLPYGTSGWSQIFRRQAPVTKPIKEVDGRVGFYTRFDWHPPVPLALNFTYYNTRGNPDDFDKGQFGWATRFFNTGIRYAINARTELTTQYLCGNTEWGRWRADGVRAVDVDFRSGYVMLSRQVKRARLSIRSETFETVDYSAPSVDNNNETGHAVTVALMVPVAAHFDLNTEFLHIGSNRPARATQAVAPRQTQSQIIMALKAHF